jgi:hypothetical protein
MTPTPRQRFTLTLEDAPQRERDGTPPAPTDVRLKRLLKAMLRGYGFRCVAVVETTPKEPDHAESKNPGAGQ